MVMRVREYAEVKEDDEDHVSPLELLFNASEREKPDSVAVRQYKVCKMAAGKTSKSILVSTAVRLAPFNLPQIRAITDHDDMDLYTCLLYTSRVRPWVVWYRQIPMIYIPVQARMDSRLCSVQRIRNGVCRAAARFSSSSGRPPPRDWAMSSAAQTTGI